MIVCKWAFMKGNLASFTLLMILTPHSPFSILLFWCGPLKARNLPGKIQLKSPFSTLCKRRRNISSIKETASGVKINSSHNRFSSIIVLTLQGQIKGTAEDAGHCRNYLCLKKYETSYFIKIKCMHVFYFLCLFCFVCVCFLSSHKHAS